MLTCTSLIKLKTSFLLAPGINMLSSNVIISVDDCLYVKKAMIAKKLAHRNTFKIILDNASCLFHVYQCCSVNTCFHLSN